MREIIKKGINNILRVVSLKQDISPEKIAKYALWPLPEETANAASSDNYYIYIINNATNTPLITCDQPVINCTTTYNTSEWEHNLELYYPISPSKAILITKTDTGTEWSAAMVEKFNTKMIDASYMLVFTNSQKRANIISEAQLNNKAIE